MLSSSLTTLSFSSHGLGLFSSFNARFKLDNQLIDYFFVLVFGGANSTYCEVSNFTRKQFLLS